jgi:hypothetical protein
MRKAEHDFSSSVAFWVQINGCTGMLAVNCGLRGWSIRLFSVRPAAHAGAPAILAIPQRKPQTATVLINQ